ncbi:hypothetical protein ATO00_13845 [Loigolactobacillus coryniformis subsp. coryniformis]|nr:hypothetical protein ATO00_13845 [Loigolactobacillus coryniformis subsp. coryniformis]
MLYATRMATVAVFLTILVSKYQILTLFAKPYLLADVDWTNAKVWQVQVASPVTSKIFGTKLINNCEVEPCFLRHVLRHKNGHRP